MTECKFEVGRIYKDSRDNLYEFVAFAKNAHESQQAVFVNQRGSIATRRIDGCVSKPDYSFQDISPISISSFSGPGMYRIADDKVLQVLGYSQDHYGVVKIKEPVLLAVCSQGMSYVINPSDIVCKLKREPFYK